MSGLSLWMASNLTFLCASRALTYRASEGLKFRSLEWLGVRAFPFSGRAVGFEFGLSHGGMSFSGFRRFLCWGVEEDVHAVLGA